MKSMNIKSQNIAGNIPKNIAEVGIEGQNKQTFGKFVGGGKALSGTITVKGSGRASVRPDYVVLSISLESKDANYYRVMRNASQHIQLLKEALGAVGIARDDVKTIEFNVAAQPKSDEPPNESDKQESDAYVITHSLQVGFDFDIKRLSRLLFVISGCKAKPALSIAFTVKNIAAVSEELLRSAAASARRNAEILCEASGAELGQLLAIDYNRDALETFSIAKYSLTDDSLYKSVLSADSLVDIVPDDIDISDTATFVWEIK